MDRTQYCKECAAAASRITELEARIVNLESSLRLCLEWLRTDCYPPDHGGHKFCMAAGDHERLEAIIATAKTLLKKR
jgi:hypothetical protein